MVIKILSLFTMLFAITALSSAQTGEATGKITDTNGETLIGANVVVKGTTIGTISNLDGIYTIKGIPSGAQVLVVSFIGYANVEAPIEIKAGQTSKADFVLKEDIAELDELIVIGYGAVKKQDATGSVVAFKPDEENRGLVVNAQDLIAGKIAGVNVTNDGGTPGGGATIRIRGGSSLTASNDPLIVIDGLAIDNEGIKGVANPLSIVNPNDIETFTVLKDASATAIYGSRASNGVIIITTKKGSKGKGLKVSYSGNTSASTLVKRMDVLSANELRNYAELLNFSDANLAYLGTSNTDWQDEIYQTGIGTDHNITLTGSTNNMPYRVSLGYTYLNGAIRTSNMQRTTTSVNLSPTFFDEHLILNANVKAMYILNRYADGGVVGSSLTMDPTQSVYDPTAELFDGYFQYSNAANYNDSVWPIAANTQAIKNPLATLNLKDDRAKSYSLLGNMEAIYKIHGFEDLGLHANLGADYSSGKQTTIISPYSSSNHYYGWDGYEQKNKYNLSFNTYAQYNKDLGLHSIDGMVGYEWQHFYNDGNSNGTGFYQPTNNDPTLAGQKYNYTTDEWATENYLVSFFGRLNYTLLDRYMFTATYRRDGSSRFKNPWGDYPSFAFAWKINEESFMEGTKNWLSQLKLRLGYGITGQQNLDLGNNYVYLPIYDKSQEHAYYTYGEKDANGDYIYYETYSPDAINEDLTWEKTITKNVGIDFGLWQGRVSGSFDYYNRETVDLLNTINQASGTNFQNTVVDNVGSLENKGYELTISGKPISKKDVVWDLGLTLTSNHNEITKLTASIDEDYFVPTGHISSGTGNNIQAHKVGYAASSFLVYETAINENGEYYFVDRYEDGIINEKDLYIYKDPAPDYMIGFTSKLQYKKFDFSFSLRSNIGGYVYNDVLASNLRSVEKANIFSLKTGGFQNVLQEAFDTYWGENFKSDNPNFNGNWFRSDYFVEKASFLRVDNITLGYSFSKPDKYDARVFATVQNPFVITGYRGLDPELSSGIDNNIYPRSMVTVVGININF